MTNNPLALMDPRGESIISWIAKKSAKKGITKALRDQLAKDIKDKIGKIGSSKFRKRLEDEFQDILIELATFDGIGVWDVIEIVVPGSELVTICLDAKKLKKIKNLVNKFDDKLDALLKVNAKKFEKSLSNLAPGQRVAKVKQKIRDLAATLGWKKNNKLSKKNNRDVYEGDDGNYYSVDTQHGRLEKLNKRGKHQGEVDIELKDKPNSKDTSGGHDIIL